VPDIRQLSHVIALAEELTVRQAARRVHISHPALLKSIRITEEALGGPLFERHGRTLDLTALGRLVVERGRRLVAEHESLRREANGFVDLERGEVFVGAGPSAARRFLPTAIARLLSHHPGLRVHATVRGWEDLLLLLIDRKIDFFVAEAVQLAGRPDLDVTVLDPTRVSWFARPDHPLARKRAFKSGELAGYPLVGPHLPQRYRDVLNDLLGPHLPPHKRPFRPAFECDDYSVLRRIVACSDCVGALPHAVMEEDYRAGVYCELPVKPPLPLSGEALVKPKNRTMQPAADLLAGFILDATREGVSLRGAARVPG
jgi:DNA-binding transcriptional LysR family regulator